MLRFSAKFTAHCAFFACLPFIRFLHAECLMHSLIVLSYNFAAVSSWRCCCCCCCTTAVRCAVACNEPQPSSSQRAPTPLSTSAHSSFLSLSLCLSHSLRPPGKPPLKAYLINALTIFSTFVIQLKRIHFIVCALLTSERNEQSEFRIENPQLSLSLLFLSLPLIRQAMTFTEMASMSRVVAGCDCCSWRTVS